MNNEKQSNDVSFDLEFKHQYQKIPLEPLLKKAIETEFSEVKNENNIEFYYKGFSDNSLNYKCKIQVKNDADKELIEQKAKQIVDEIFIQNNEKVTALLNLINNS